MLAARPCVRAEGWTARPRRRLRRRRRPATPAAGCWGAPLQRASRRRYRQPAQRASAMAAARRRRAEAAPPRDRRLRRRGLRQSLNPPAHSAAAACTAAGATRALASWANRAQARRRAAQRRAARRARGSGGAWCFGSVTPPSAAAGLWQGAPRRLLARCSRKAPRGRQVSPGGRKARGAAIGKQWERRPAAAGEGTPAA